MRKGSHMTVEQKKHLSEAHIGQISWNKGNLGFNKGITRSPETKKKMSEARLKRKLELGYINSPETKKKISDFMKTRPPQSAESRKKQSESLKGHVMSEKTKRRLYESRKGSHHSEETKKKLREARIKQISFQHFNGLPVIPTISQNEFECLNELEKLYNYKIIRCKQIIGFFPDGYIEELNLIIEFDEPFHFKDEILTERDQSRQKELTDYLHCEFFRIKETDWLQNKEKILEEFTKIIQDKIYLIA